MCVYVGVCGGGGVLCVCVSGCVSVCADSTGAHIHPLGDTSCIWVKRRAAPAMTAVATRLVTLAKAHGATALGAPM